MNRTYLGFLVFLACAAVAAALYAALSIRNSSQRERNATTSSTSGAVDFEVTPPPLEAPPPTSPSPSVDAGEVRTTFAWGGTGAPKSTLRKDFESDPRDDGAAAAEDRIREIFAAQPGIEGVVRNVRCSKRVCRIDARWSRATTVPYNAALVQIVKENTRELEITPDGQPDGLVVPVSVYVRRAPPPP